MKTKYLLSFGLIFMLSASILFPVKIFASWAYAFVVWDGYVYVVTEDVIEEVDEEIGHVTKYSDTEGTYSGNFSNVYPKGSKYYSIIGVNTDEAIAVQDENGQYIKANRSGEYAGNKFEMRSISSWVIGVILLALLGILFLSKKK